MKLNRAQRDIDAAEKWAEKSSLDISMSLDGTLVMAER
jgi:hypothetical protein